MSPRAARRIIACGAFVLACGIALQARAEESLLRAVPLVHGLYQQRLERVRAGLTPQVFLGTASVVPDRSQSYAVSIGLTNVPPELGHYCGGAIVDPHWVLTAAHCVSTGTPKNGKYEIAPLTPDKIQVLDNTNILFRGGQRASVTRIVLNPGHRLTPKHVPEDDLALLYLPTALKGTPIKIATEAQSRRSLQAGNQVRILGWGTATFSPDSPISNNLLFAFVDVVDRAQCNRPDVYDGAVSDSMFCAGVGVADACQGDSGGPTVAYAGGVPLLVGIDSWGVGCSNKKYPGVYVNVAKFHGWINEIIAKAQ